MELLPNNASTPPRPRRKRGASKARSRTDRARYNGRSREAVRVRTLVAGFRTQLGEAARNPVIAAAVMRAAELAMLAEQLRARAIRGETVDFDALIKLEGAADRAVRRLGITKPEAPKAPSLDDYLRQKYPDGAADDAIDDGVEDEMAIAAPEEIGAGESGSDQGAALAADRENAAAAAAESPRIIHDDDDARDDEDEP